MSQSKVAVGSVGYWGLMRFAQVFMICLGLLFLFVAARPVTWEFILILILVVWFLFVIYLDSCVYGFADEDGVHFRRYVSMDFVPWTKIARVSWFGKNILSIHLKWGNLLRREMNANRFFSGFGNIEEEPDLVRWLLVAKPPGADGIELRPWGAETESSRKVSAVLRVVVLILCSAILIWLLVTMLSASHRP